MTEFIPGRALIVAVSDYSYVTSLPNAVINDASDVAAALTDEHACGYDPHKVTVLLNESATTSNVIRAFEDVKDLATDEPFVFFFSGHGDRQTTESGTRSYLLCQDSDLDRLDETALRDDQLLEWLGRLPSRRQVIILDACHAGGIGVLKSTRQMPKGVGDLSSFLLSSGRGRVLLTSCRPEEYSMVANGSRNSVFSESLLKGMRGQARIKDDGTVGVLDLFDFVSQEVPKNADQHPILKTDDLEGNFSIVRATKLKPCFDLQLNKEDQISAIVDLLAELFPLGPTQDQIWTRAGGDLSRLSIVGHGRAQWHNAISLIGRGGGIPIASLLNVVAGDFPTNKQLKQLIQSI
jgi:hypothetical protein